MEDGASMTTQTRVNGHAFWLVDGQEVLVAVTNFDRVIFGQ
jgi:hypothetical protein